MACVCACVRAYVRCARARSRGLPHTRECGCVRAHRWLDSTLAMHHEAGPSVQMMRVRFCLEAAEKPSYPAAYGILAMSMWSFAVLLSYVVWPRHMMVRRATSARGGVLSRFYGSPGGATGSGRRPLRLLGGLPFCQPPSKQRRLGNPTRAMSNVQSAYPARCYRTTRSG